MKTKQLLTLIVSMLMTISLAMSVFASNNDSTMNLFKSPGRKQTAKDFKPAPANMETNFGTLEFDDAKGSGRIVQYGVPRFYNLYDDPKEAYPLTEKTPEHLWVRWPMA